MTYVPIDLRTLVIARAQDSCEYCLIHADYAVLVHEIDHVIAEKHGGATAAENLAYACAQCNRFKGSDIATFDPQTDQVVPLFNPRTQSWSEHFRLDGVIIVALSPTGRATERSLQLNLIDRILLRKELLSAGRYPYQFGGRDRPSKRPSE
jgi:5-methylcytosine-specific restriction endonuclease McrA